jgi:phage-related protein
MARHLTVGSIIEKNKIASDELFLILIKVLIKNEDGDEVAVLTFVKNSENVVFNGEAYQAANFELDITVENNSEPQITLTAQDQTRALMQYIEAYSGCVGSTVIMTVVNSAALDQPPEIQETFKVISSSNNQYVVKFDLGTDSAISKRFPNYRQFKDRCSWKYKGTRCKYAGSIEKCDYTLLGDNGCLVHNNVANFGGYPGLNGSL